MGREAVELYARELEALPVIASEIDDQVVGIASLNQHTPFAAEIHVMGVLPDFHRRGIGRQLMANAEAIARGNDLALLTVRTLSPARENSDYELTRALRSTGALGSYRPRSFQLSGGQQTLRCS